MRGNLPPIHASHQSRRELSDLRVQLRCSDAMLPMRFLPDPEPPPAHHREHPGWRWLLLGSTALGVVCAMSPWIRVQFVRLFGSHDGPPGWQSSAGFTCFCSCALVAVLSFVETDTASSRRAVRPGSLLLAALSALVILGEWFAGPGAMRGVSASWTPWFYAALVSMPLLLVACARRWAALPHARG